MPSRAGLAGSTGQRVLERNQKWASEGSRGRGAPGLRGRRGRLSQRPPSRAPCLLPPDASHGMPPHILLDPWGAGLPSFRPHRVCTSFRAEEPSGVVCLGHRAGPGSQQRLGMPWEESGTRPLGSHTPTAISDPEDRRQALPQPWAVVTPAGKNSQEAITTS